MCSRVIWGEEDVFPYQHRCNAIQCDSRVKKRKTAVDGSVDQILLSSYHLQTKWMTSMWKSCIWTNACPKYQWMNKQDKFHQKDGRFSHFQITDQMFSKSLSSSIGPKCRRTWSGFFCQTKRFGKIIFDMWSNVSVKAVLVEERSKTSSQASELR